MRNGSIRTVRVRQGSTDSSRLIIQPVTPDRWRDLERLFGDRGACGGCWCMVWRLRPVEWKAGKGTPNRLALKAIVAQGPAPGLLAYLESDPVGWCAVAPREHYVHLTRSRVLRALDAAKTWSISCLF